LNDAIVTLDEGIYEIDFFQSMDTKKC